jgi:hypothetical protein
MTGLKFLSTLFLMGLVAQSLGFAPLSTSFRKLHATNAHQTMDTSRTSLSAFTLFDPNVEAEVLTDMSHLALDFTSLSSSSKALLKKSSVIGRVLILFADYIPDHSIHPEELAIQLIMLGVAIKNLTSRSTEK